MNPNTKEEFVELSQLIVGKLSNYEVTVIHCEVIYQIWETVLFDQISQHQEESLKHILQGSG